MAEIIKLPIFKPEPYTVNSELAVGGYWATCHRCTRNCFRAGHNFIACAAHSEHDNGDEHWKRYLNAKEVAENG